MEISVSILSEKDNYKSIIEKINESNADYIHLDILDNTYISEESFSFDDFKNVNFSKKIDVHLMSSDLEKQIELFSNLNPEFITFHEEVGNTLNYIKLLKEKNIKCGLAINPDTDIEKVYPYLELVDLILIMSVNPGKGGQKFNTSVISKLQELKEIQDRYFFKIEVDGGLNEETKDYVKPYVDIAVSGSFVTKNSNINESINILKN